MLPLGKTGDNGTRDFSVLYLPVIGERTIILNKKFTFKKAFTVQHLKQQTTFRPNYLLYSFS